MSSWRPKGWANPYQEHWDSEMYDVHAAFEAGADAMLEALKVGGAEVLSQGEHFWETDYHYGWQDAGSAMALEYDGQRGHLVFIPEVQP